MASEPTAEEIRQAVRQRYAAAAERARSARASCCSSQCSCGGPAPLYGAGELAGLPQAATQASLGCGNPLLLAALEPGQVVLDLGSGGGIDVLLAARVGPTGKVYGLDMTGEMLELARANARQAGVTNADFIQGQIEAIPLPDQAVDVVISNCVINLSTDKDAVLREAYRVLRPGGRFAVADVVVQGPPLSPSLRQNLALWSECVGGALTEDEYRAKLAAAGFTGVELVEAGAYNLEDYACCLPAELAGAKIVSALIKATRPAP